MLRERPFVRDGLVSIALAVLWSACSAMLCKPGGVVCDFSRYLFDLVMQPGRDGIGRLLDLFLPLTGLVLPGPGSTDRRIDMLATAIAIPLQVLYWFMLGALTCAIWRFVRGRLQLLLGRAGSKS